jgi:DNA-binding NarL/FixJ family response regulator
LTALLLSERVVGTDEKWLDPTAVEFSPAAALSAEPLRRVGQVPRIVLVDDEPDFRETLRDMLSDQGFAVVAEAGDGEEAVRSVARTNPDVVLMDLRMPTMDGIQATRSIKSQFPNVQVVMLSAYGDPALQTGADEAGVYCYLVKGCPPDMIRDMLQYAWRFKGELERSPQPEGIHQALRADPDQ